MRSKQVQIPRFVAWRTSAGIQIAAGERVPDTMNEDGWADVWDIGHERWKSLCASQHQGYGCSVAEARADLIESEHERAAEMRVQ